MKLRREKLKTSFFNTIEHYLSQIQEDVNQENSVVKVPEQEDKRVIGDFLTLKIYWTV
jgi:hypothetical protein